jgi:hypothetical protein
LHNIHTKFRDNLSTGATAEMGRGELRDFICLPFLLKVRKCGGEGGRTVKLSPVTVTYTTQNTSRGVTEHHFSNEACSHVDELI